MFSQNLHQLAHDLPNLEILDIRQFRKWHSILAVSLDILNEQIYLEERGSLQTSQRFLALLASLTKAALDITRALVTFLYRARALDALERNQLWVDAVMTTLRAECVEFQWAALRIAWILERRLEDGTHGDVVEDCCAIKAHHVFTVNVLATRET